MKFSRVARSALVLVLLCMALSAYSADTKTAAMIISIPKGDPFLNLAYSGLEKLGKDKGIKTKIIEALDKSEYAEQIRSMAELGTNPIYVVWDDLGAAALEVAPDFPDTKFIILDAYVITNLKNVKTVVVEPGEASFIAGFVAANTTKTNRVAFVGSMDMPVINKFKVGFEAGVHYGNPKVKVESVYIGNANDPVKGQEIAKMVIGNGADVVMHAANKAGLGVIKGCEEKKVKAIGVDDWQGDISPVVFWSALKDIAGAVYKSGESVLDGTFQPGMTSFGVKSGIKLYDERDFNKLDKALQAKVLQLVSDMKSGKVTVSSK